MKNLFELSMDHSEAVFLLYESAPVIVILLIINCIGYKLIVYRIREDVWNYLQYWDFYEMDEMPMYRANDIQPPEESGWKLIRHDVFRPPAYPYLFSFIVSNGNHLLSCINPAVMPPPAAELYVRRLGGRSPFCKDHLK